MNHEFSVMEARECQIVVGIDHGYPLECGKPVKITCQFSEWPEPLDVCWRHFTEYWNKIDALVKIGE